MKTKKTSKAKKEVKRPVQAEEENVWISAMQDALSPYWSARFEYQSEPKSSILAVNGLEEKTRRAA